MARYKCLVFCFFVVVKSTVEVGCNCLVTCFVVIHKRHGCLHVEYEVGLVRTVLLGVLHGSRSSRAADAFCERSCAVEPS